MLFSDAASEYMDDKKKRLRATTIEGYASAIRCHLMPKWGKREIESISFDEVQDWVDGFALVRLLDMTTILQNMSIVNYLEHADDIWQLLLSCSPTSSATLRFSYRYIGRSCETANILVLSCL